MTDKPKETAQVTGDTPTKTDITVTQASDTTIPGGIYISDGQVVDANGEPVKGYKVVNGQAVKE